MNIRVTEQEMQKHSEDYYLTILCGNGIFRLSRPRNVNDIILAVKTFQKNTANGMQTKESYEVFYKGIQIIGSLQGVGIPSGSRIEVKIKTLFH